MLEAHALSVTAGSKTLLRDVSLCIRPGEVLAVIGANGAGKSTLLKVLSGDIIPVTGEVSMDGRPLAQWPLRQRAKVRAVLPQNTMLSFPFTVLEVVTMGRFPHNNGVPSLHDRAIARQAMLQLDVTELEQRLYQTLSGGERQRVQIARVLTQIWEADSRHPRYLLLDEPTSSLDLAHQHLLLNMARRYAHQQGIAVLAILHDINLAAQYADRIALLQQGRLSACGTPRSVISAQNIEAAFAMQVEVISHPRMDCLLVLPLADIPMPAFLPVNPVGSTR